VDRQIRGPYILWHHTHTFEEHGGATLCKDDVRYRPRGGSLVNWLFVRRDIESIFAFRTERLADIFQETGLSTKFPIV
jgi:ligand-binding SRPBCC domain-containing protein